MTKPPIFESGSAYLRHVTSFGAASVLKVSEQIDAEDQRHSMLGTSLMALYQIATCYPRCRGGDHILEALFARAHNHGVAAFLLARHAYYDEALNLARSIAEIANLLMLFLFNPNEYRGWIDSNRQRRAREYGPGAVRGKLDRLDVPVPVSTKLYRELCILVTHPTPETKPNAHSKQDPEFGAVGGIFQETGYARCLDDTGYVTLAAARVGAAMFKREDLTVLLDAVLEETIDHFQAKPEDENKPTKEEPRY